MADWDYGGAWRRHDMRGVIGLPNGSRVQVHDITGEVPRFMFDADTIFCDPPCSQGNLRSFYTKAGQALGYTFDEFERALWRWIEDISPRHVFIETFLGNHEAVLQAMRERYAHVRVYGSHYYRRAANRCWIVHGSRVPAAAYPLDGIDEAEIIAWLCAHHDYQTIGDPCMGRGLVGRHAYLNGRCFVGTELNPKRLAVLVEFIRSAENKRSATPA